MKITRFNYVAHSGSGDNALHKQLFNAVEAGGLTGLDTFCCDNDLSYDLSVPGILRVKRNDHLAGFRAICQISDYLTVNPSNTRKIVDAPARTVASYFRDYKEYDIVEVDFADAEKKVLGLLGGTNG